MGGVVVNFSILNQRGTPAFFADVLANRPEPGFVGRIFIDTNIPTTGIYRDTGTSWEVISGGSSSVPNLQSVTDVGNTTNNNVVFQARGIFGGNATSGFHRLIVRDTGIFNLQRETLSVERSKTYDNTVSFINGPAYGSIGATDTFNLTASITFPIGVSSATGVFSGVTLRPAGFNITQTQAGGVRALSGYRSQLTIEQASVTNSTISHYTHFFATSIFKTDNSNPVTITNNYGLIISDQTEQSTGLTLTNRFGIAQFGVNDRNFFLGRVTVGTSVDGGFQFDVNGTARFQGQITGSGDNFFRTSTNTANWFSDGNNPLRIIASGGNFQVNNAAIVACSGIELGTILNTVNPESFTTVSPIQSNLNTIGTGRNLNSINRVVFEMKTIGGGSVSNAPLVEFFKVLRGNVTGYSRYVGINVVDCDVILNTTSGSTIIGGSTINASAKLQVDSINSGFLPPRMTTTERNAIASPAAGLIIYNTTTARHQGWNGTIWNDFY